MLHPALPLVFVAAVLIAGAVAALRARAKSGQHAWSAGAALTVADVKRRLAEEKLRRLTAERAAGRHARLHDTDHLFTHPHAPIKLAS